MRSKGEEFSTAWTWVQQKHSLSIVQTPVPSWICPSQAPSMEQIPRLSRHVWKMVQQAERAMGFRWYISHLDHGPQSELASCSQLSRYLLLVQVPQCSVSVLLPYISIALPPATYHLMSAQASEEAGACPSRFSPQFSNAQYRLDAR